MLCCPRYTYSSVYVHAHTSVRQCSQERPARLSEPANQCLSSVVRLCGVKVHARPYSVCLCAFAWESVFCSRSGSLFKPMRLHYCDPSPLVSVPALTYCGVDALQLFLGRFFFFVHVFVGNLSSYAFVFYPRVK